LKTKMEEDFMREDGHRTEVIQTDTS